MSLSMFFITDNTVIMLCTVSEEYARFLFLVNKLTLDHSSITNCSFGIEVESIGCDWVLDEGENIGGCVK